MQLACEKRFSARKLWELCFYERRVVSYIFQCWSIFWSFVRWLIGFSKEVIATAVSLVKRWLLLTAYVWSSHGLVLARFRV